MNDINCRFYDECEAPLCPMQHLTLEHGCWYADEQICRVRRFQSLPWIKRQKKIAKLNLTVDDGFFTVRMLEAIQVLTKNIRGANPDIPESEEQWIKDRTQKKPTTTKNQAGDSKSKKEDKQLVLTFS